MFGEYIVKRLIKHMDGSIFAFPAIPPFPQNLDGIDWYIHIPFCKGKCPYCPFRSFLYEEERVQTYVKAVKKEISLYKDLLGTKSIGDVYFGGGTPSLCPDAVVEIIDYLRSKFEVKGEIGMEANPNEVTDLNTCDILWQGGVTKMSLGVQTFDDKLLKKIRRRYVGDSASDAVKILIDRGFYLSIDMIHGLPGQTISSIEGDLKILSGLEPHQICYYPLVRFPTTRFYYDIKKGKLDVPNKKEQKRMYKLICDYLNSNGFLQDSFCNFKHRELGTKEYLTCEKEETIGIGVSAFSKIPSHGLIYINTYSFSEYIDAVEVGLPIAIGVELSDKGRRKMTGYMITYYAWKSIFSNETGENEARFKYRYGVELDRNKGKKLNRYLLILKLLGVVKDNLSKYEFTHRGHYYGMRIFRKFMAGGEGATAEKFMRTITREPWPMQSSEQPQDMVAAAYETRRKSGDLKSH